MPTLMKRLFDSPPAQELLTRAPSHGGSYRLDQSTELILEARRRKRQAGSDLSVWPTVLECLALVISVALAAFLLLWIVCAGNDPKASSWAFSASLWAFSGLMVVCGVIGARKI